MLLPRLLPALLTLALLPACSRDRQAHDHDHTSGSHGHTHVAPHGGTAVLLGDHAYHLELVQDAQAGLLTAYVLDGHLERFIRVAQTSLVLEATSGGKTEVLTLEAVANPATSETVGDTSQFQARAEWLKHTPEWSGKVRAVSVRGSTFENVAFRFPQGNES